jgi:CIC family chloride channel protein
MGWYMPEVLGVGYDYVERVLGGDFPLRTVAVLVVLKIVATAVCYSSGNAGGIFGPSLFIGAMIGGAVGSVAHAWFPAYTANPGAYALIGMGTAFAGIIRTPLTSVIMIFELTRDYSIIVPLMISNLVSFFISRTLQPEPIYEALALQEGVHLPTRHSQAAQSGIRVGDIMEPAELDAASALGAQAHVHSDQPLSLALERMGAAGVGTLPVVSRADTAEVQGVVTLAAILAAYRIEDRNDHTAE